MTLEQTAARRPWVAASTTTRLRQRLRLRTLRERLMVAIMLAIAGLLGLRQWELSQLHDLEQQHRQALSAQIEAQLALRRLQLFYNRDLALRWSRSVIEGPSTPRSALQGLRAAQAAAEGDWRVVLQAAWNSRAAPGAADGGLARERAAADVAATRLGQILEVGDRAALASFISADLDPAVHQLDLQLEMAAGILRLDEPGLRQRLGDEARRQRLSLDGLLAAAVAALLAAIVLLFRGLDRDIARLTAHARRISDRDFHTPLGEAPPGELQELGRAFVTMQDALGSYEKDLEGSEQLFTLSADLMCIAGTDGYFRRLNPAFEKTLGFSRQELCARPFTDFIHPQDVESTLLEVDKLARGLPTVSLENRYRCKDGSYKWLSWKCQPAGDGTLYAVARDVSEHKRLLAELHEQELLARAANQAKSMFLASMSHEIRTPLIGVLGMMEVLGKSRLDPEQRRQFNVVLQSAQSLLEIVGDILDYSKIEAGKVELAPEPLSVRDLVSRVISTFSATAESKGLNLFQEVAPEVAPAHLGDSARLRQVLANLVGNAIKFTERGSVALAVRVVRGGAGVQRLAFSVSDTGIGIEPTRLSRLFQPFTQSDATTSRRFGGTGLGLVICRRLADLMGGTVNAASVPGKGTTMTLEVPLPIGDAAAVPDAAKPREEQIVTRARPERERALREGSLLLLAEDHPVNREVLTRQLDLAGFLADTAESGTAALDKFRAGIYGLVLTDLHMPGLDGFQLTAAIRKHERERGLRRTPIIALTANVLRQDVERCLTSGMDDYLSKPVTIRQLCEKLRQWLPDLAWDEAPAVASQESAPGHEGAIQESVLHLSAGNDEALARGLLNLYCRTQDDDLKAFESARREGPAAVRRVAHRIKGAALTVGAREVARIAQIIEHDAEKADDPKMAALADELQAAIARVIEYGRARA